MANKLALWIKNRVKFKRKISRFACMANYNGYCTKVNKMCFGWRNCNLGHGYGAPCPYCKFETTYDNKRCNSCKYNDWKTKVYEQ